MCGKERIAYLAGLIPAYRKLTSRMRCTNNKKFACQLLGEMLAVVIVDSLYGEPVELTTTFRKW